jgi:hypothetical protein
MAVTRQKCELMVNPELKRKVDTDAASIRDGFPTGMSRPALRALYAAGFSELRQLAKVREADIAALHGMGPKAMGLLRAGLQARRLRFKP